MTQIITYHEPADLEEEIIATKADNPDLPSRWDQALYKVQRGFMGKEWAKRMVDWFAANQYQMTEGGDGKRRRNWEIGDVLTQEGPHHELKESLLEAAPKALARCKVPSFEVDWLEMHALVHHHLDQFQWHTDHYESSGVDYPETRTLTFCYYLRPEKGSFHGGQLEFFDGTWIEHAHDQLVWINPYQVHRIRRVSAMTDRFLDGRISLIGWLHCKEGEEHNNDH